MNENTNVTENVNTSGNADSTDSAAAVSTNKGAENVLTEGKMFTHSEMDAIIKQRLERQAKGQPTKEELKAFKEWQDSNAGIM